jgi:hypothetical protein
MGVFPVISFMVSVYFEPEAMKLCWPDKVYFPWISYMKSSKYRASGVASGFTFRTGVLPQADMTKIPNSGKKILKFIKPG